MVAPQALIFDMDGLMLNSEPLYQQAWQAAAQEMGFHLKTEWYLSLVGRSSAELPPPHHPFFVIRAQQR